MNSINYNYKHKADDYSRAQLIKDTGFDGVFIYSQYEPKNYIDEILRVGLKIETLHLPYKLFNEGVCIDSRYVNVLWTDTLEGESYVQWLTNEIEFARCYGIKTLVMHVTGGNTPPPVSQIGITRMKRLVEHCEHNNMVLCIENLRRLDYLQYIFKHIESPSLKFCFDSGHANYMTGNANSFDWSEFGKKLYCLHLNDNDGNHDSHQIPFNGTINWFSLMNEIYEFNSNINLTLEVRVSKDQKEEISETAFLNQCMDSLLKLNSLRRINNGTK